MNDEKKKNKFAINILEDDPEWSVKITAILDKLFPKRCVRSVMLINPPDADASMFRYTTAKRGRYTNYPPYGLAVIAQNLRRMGVDVNIVNLNHEILKKCNESNDETEFDFEKVWKAKLRDMMDSFCPDLIGITCMFTMSHNSFRSVCEYLSGFDVPLSAGGVHVTNNVELVLNDVPGVDFIFLQEGDLAFNEFVQIINAQRDINELSQMIINDDSAHYYFSNERRPTSDEISLIPAFDILELDEYTRYGTIGSFYCFKKPKARLATVLSNRGCRARCTFCSVYNFNGPSVRTRSIASVVDELELLQDKYGIEHIMWLDDDLLNYKHRAMNLFNEMVRRNIRLTWDASNGVIAASCTDEMISAAAESGCIALNIGMESGNSEILREIKKPGNVDTFLNAAEILRKYEQIYASVFLIIGFPNETMSMIWDTINISREMNLDWYRVSTLQPLPNTPIYDSMAAEGLIDDRKSEDVHYVLGAFGEKGNEVHNDTSAVSAVEHAVSSIPKDVVPTHDQISDIWIYMNYHLNFQRLFRETRQLKVSQQMQFLRMVSDIISPGNGFALYFNCYLQAKATGKVSSESMERLNARIKTSPYWRDCLNSFGLLMDDLLSVV